VKNKWKNKIHRDKNGREFIKETYFIGGKMKFRRIYVIDGIPADEFYERNATDLDFYLNGDYELMNSEKDSNNHCNVQNKNESDLPDNEDLNDLPF
jgi:putative NIF3 family GTP cyclohydrolase 1 type 2